MPQRRFNLSGKRLSLVGRRVQGGALNLNKVFNRVKDEAENIKQNVQQLPNKLKGLNLDAKIGRELKRTNEILGGTIMEQVKKNPLEAISLPKFDGKKKFNRNNVRISL